MKTYTFTLPNFADRFIVTDRTTGNMFYAHNYINHHVIIDLSSSYAPGPELTLFEGGRYKGGSDSDPETGTSSNVRLGRTLEEGTYTIMARVPVEAPHDATFDLHVEVFEAIPHDGSHEADHRVEYRIDDSVPLEGEGLLLRRSVRESARKWNSALASSWTNAAIVLNSTSGAERTVKMGDEDDCGGSIACVDGFTGGHFGRGSLVIEHPTTIRVDGIDTPVTWTANASLHLVPIEDAGIVAAYYWYMPATVLHEFGHTLGLDDLYDNRTQGRYYNGRYDDYLMGKQGTRDRVPTVDVDYLEQVYRHHGGRPH